MADNSSPVGRAVPRVDARAKAGGAHRYPSDLGREGMLWVQVLRAPHPHARLRAVDTAAARALPGVACVLTAADVPGTNAFGLIVADQPVLAHDLVRCEGDAVAIVAAETDALARRARDLLRVDWEPLPLVTDPRLALEPGAPRLHPQGNLCAELQLGTGNLAAGLAAADVVLEWRYQTGRQAHAFLEPEAGIAASGDDGLLTLSVGGQNPFNDRRQVAAALGLDEAKLRVQNPMMGGAFGGKEDISVQIVLALVTQRTGRPCRLRLDREESMRAGVKRHPFQVRYRAGVTRDGRLTACEVDLLADAGAYTALSPAVLGLAANHCCGPYAWGATRISARAAFTNNGNASAFRGFGNPQVAVGLEQQLDRLAQAIGMDPIALRRRNAIRTGQISGAGFAVRGAVTLPAVLDSVERSDLWRERAAHRRTASPWKRRGVGLAAVWQSFGLGAGIEPGAHTRVALQPGGRYLAHMSAPDLGNGGVTTCLQLAAGELGCQVEDLDVVNGDSAGPNSGSSNASRTTFLVGSSILVAAARLREAILAAALRLGSDLVPEAGPGAAQPGPRTGAPPAGGVLAGPPRLLRDRVVLGDRAIALAEVAARAGPLAADGYFKPETPEAVPFGAPPAMTCSAQVALVEVDTLTGEVEVLRLESHLDVGRAVNPQGVRGQSAGGMAQGLGYALLEDAAYAEGRIQNPRLSTYLVPSIRDVPAALTTVILEDPEPLSPHGGRGMGEIGLTPTAAALCNALADATGERFDRLPVTPEQVLAALSAREA